MQRTRGVSLAATQVGRLHRFRATKSVDAHCHCLPGLDDGPPSVDDAIALCKLLVRDGFTDVITTPHALGRYDGYNWAPEVRRAVSEMQSVLNRERIPLRLHGGAEVRLDERIPRLIESDQIMTLADAGEFLLLELPTSGAISARAVAESFRGVPVAVVLAHAERYDLLRRDPPAIQDWLDAGVIIQVNAPSLLGEGPSGAREAAMYWLANGCVSLIATDSHSVDTRRPRMTEAIEFLEREFGLEVTRRLCITNPMKLLEGDGPRNR